METAYTEAPSEISGGENQLAALGKTQTVLAAVVLDQQFAALSEEFSAWYAPFRGSGPDPRHLILLRFGCGGRHDERMITILIRVVKPFLGRTYNHEPLMPIHE